VLAVPRIGGPGAGARVCAARGHGARRGRSSGTATRVITGVPDAGPRTGRRRRTGDPSATAVAPDGAAPCRTAPG